MKSQAFRVLSGITAAITLIALPAQATAAGPADPDPTPTVSVVSPAPARPPAPAAAAGLPFRLSVPGATAHGTYELAKTPGKTKPTAVLPPVAKPGTGVAGIGQPAQAQPGKAGAQDRRTTSRGVAKPEAQLVINLKVGDRTSCGVLQLTRNGPADGIEWYTIGALCKSGTAVIRIEATRLPWSGGTLPSLRLCNGLRPALAEGDDCDTYNPPRIS